MEHAATPPARWNSTEVAKYLLPFLRFCDAKRNSDTADESLDALQQDMMSCYGACPAAYRQLHRVYTHADDSTLQAWFGGIDCDDALLEDVFATIEQCLQSALAITSAQFDSSLVNTSASAAQKAQQATLSQQASPRRHAASLGEDASFRSLFVISRTQKDEETGQTRVRRLDLLVPFLELCRCGNDAERIECEHRCRRALEVYENDYRHAMAQYREQYPTDEDAQLLLPETRLCMQLIAQLFSRLEYEADLNERREALTYERGGLGWFGRARKKEIDDALLDIDLQAVELKIADEEERLQAAIAPLQARLEAMENELAVAPITAFGRKKELKQGIRQTQEEIAEIEAQSTLDALNAQRATLLKKKR